jgi:hypothetical protein
MPIGSTEVQRVRYPLRYVILSSEAFGVSPPIHGKLPFQKDVDTWK